MNSNSSISGQHNFEEAVIKYENCDVLDGNRDVNTTRTTMNPGYYGGQSHQQQHTLQQNHNNAGMAMKRNFEQMQQSNGSGGVPGGGGGNYGSSGNSTNMNNAYFPPHSYGGGGNIATHSTDYDMFHHLNARMDLYGAAQQPDGKPMKKYKRGESSLLFNPPFFKLLDGFTSPNHKDAIAARCYACGKVVRGNKSISSNFIKHMKRGHPEINKIYDSYKIYRIKTGVLPHLSQIMDGKVDEKDDSCGIVGDSNDENGSYIDASAMLDSSEVGECDEDNKHSENSENDDDSINMINNPQSAGTSDGKPENTDKTEPSNKLLEAISKLMDDKLREFVKQEDIEELRKSVNDLHDNKQGASSFQHITSSSGDNSALIELKKELEHLKQECSALRLSVQQSQASKRQLQNELESVDKMLHQRKLIIRNLKVSDPTDPEKSVQKLFKEKLGLENISIVNYSIIPSTKSLPDSNKKCILIELQHHQDSKTIFRQIPKLKDTGIFIESEISPLQRKRKDKLMIVRKELLRRKPDLKVMVRGTTLVVNGQQFYWDDVEGLCHDANKEALELNAIEYLKILTTLDLREFIDILQNYDVQVR